MEVNRLKKSLLNILPGFVNGKKHGKNQQRGIENGCYKPDSMAQDIFRVLQCGKSFGIGDGQEIAYHRAKIKRAGNNYK